jgi:hypothetical protein
MRRLVHLLLLLLLTAHRIRAQRTRFTFGSFQLRFVIVAGDDNNDSCSSGKDGDGTGALWDETAEDIRSGAETCLRTIQCVDFNNQTPFFVGLGNVACVIENEDEAAVGDDETTITIDFVGGGAMDFNGDVPLEPKMVEQCVQSVLQSNECVKIYASYEARIVSPANFTASWRSYPDIITASGGGGGGEEGDNNGLASQEEDHSSSITTTHTTGTSANMTRPFSVLSGTCSAAVVLAFLVAVFFYRKRRRNHARNNKKQNDAGLSMTDLDRVEEAGGGGGSLAKSDSLLGPKPPKSGELGRMLDEQQQKSAATAGAMMMIPMGDHDTPTTIREADASFGTTSTSSEDDEDDDAVEVGLQSLQTPTGPYDTRHVADDITAAGETEEEDGLPAILIPEEKSTFLVVEPGSFCAPFPVETSYDDEPIVTSSETTTTTTEPLTNIHTCGILCKATPSTDLPELGPSSDDDDDLFLVDWRPSDDGGNNNNNNTRSYESMVEITSDDYESAILMDDDDADDDHSCTSSSSQSEDHEFEPDAYWDPDDNSISTADAAGLDAMWTGGFSFQPTTVTGDSLSATTAPTKNETTNTVRPIESLPPPPPLFNWICHGPALCSSSTSSLPSLLGKQQEGRVEDPLSVRQRTKSYCGGGCQPFR